MTTTETTRDVITIDRATRDVLRDTILSNETPQLEGIHEVLRCGTRDEYADLQRHIDWIVGLIDQLGWEEDHDGEDYRVTVELPSFRKLGRAPVLRDPRHDRVQRAKS